MLLWLWYWYLDFKLFTSSYIFWIITIMLNIDFKQKTGIQVFTNKSGHCPVYEYDFVLSYFHASENPANPGFMD